MSGKPVLGTAVGSRLPQQNHPPRPWLSVLICSGQVNKSSSPLVVVPRYGYAEVVYALQPHGGGAVVFRVLWLTLCTTPNRDPISGFPIFKRWSVDHATLPPLVPMQAVLAVEHFVHFCGGGGHSCEVRAGKIHHCYLLNDTFVHRPRPAGRNVRG